MDSSSDLLFKSKRTSGLQVQVGTPLQSDHDFEFEFSRLICFSSLITQSNDLLLNKEG